MGAEKGGDHIDRAVFCNLIDDSQHFQLVLGIETVTAFYLKRGCAELKGGFDSSEGFSVQFIVACRRNCFD